MGQQGVVEAGEEHGGGREAGDRGLVHDAASCVTEVTLICSLCAPGLDCRHCSLLHLPDVPLLPLLRCSMGARQQLGPVARLCTPPPVATCDTGPGSRHHRARYWVRGDQRPVRGHATWRMGLERIVRS